MGGMTRQRRLVASVGAFATLATIVAVGCGDDDATTKPASDAGSDTSQPDVQQPGDDAGNDVSGNDGGANAGQPQPKLVPISLTGHDRFFGVTFDAAGNIYVTGVTSATTAPTDDWQSFVAKFTPAGALDTTFGPNADGIARVNLAVGTNGEVTRAIVVQSTGKIVIAGEAEHPAAADARDRDIYLARFNANGTIDTTFGPNGDGIAPFDLSGGEVSGPAYSRDTSWGLNLLAGDKLLFTGAIKRTGATDLDWAIVRTDANGALDATWAGTGVFTLDIGNFGASPRNATVLADGSVVGTGYYTDTTDPVNPVVKPVMFKVDPTGVLSTTFAGGVGYYTEAVQALQAEVYGAASQGTSFVTAGYGRDTGSTNDWISLRIKADGTRDMTYGTNGKAVIDPAGAGFNDNARAVAVMPDDRVLLIGGARPTATKSIATLWMLTKDGQPDLTFGAKGLRTYDLGGVGDFFWASAISPDKKKLVIVGLYGAAPNAGAGNTDDDGAMLILPLP